MRTVAHYNQTFIEDVIRSCDICFVAMADGEGIPYVLPMNFGYKNKTVYLHSAPSGRKIDILNQNKNVSITFTTDSELVYQHKQVACSYRVRSLSVIISGKVEFIEDDYGKREALNILMENYSVDNFDYSKPAVRNVKVWKVKAENMTCREFGAPAKKYNDSDPDIEFIMEKK
ncbi:MAG: pyridoxamine 5'-phosphate oxidase family protein [Chlorobi bacterium]|nr:pyridoxamine 5'-phosphate oxidase family protein [Chlorobiota bacterium]